MYAIPHKNPHKALDLTVPYKIALDNFIFYIVDINAFVKLIWMSLDSGYTDTASAKYKKSAKY
jgi:hypothetical protein